MSSIEAIQKEATRAFRYSVNFIRSDRYFYIVLLIVLIVIGAFSYLYTFPVFGDIAFYFERVSNGEGTGYPIFAEIIFRIPFLFAKTLEAYTISFMIMIGLLCIGLYLILERIIVNLDMSISTLRVVFIISIIVLLDITFTRFDLVPTVFMAVSLFFLFTERHVVGWISLGIGTLLKSFPFFTAPFFLIPLVLERNIKEILKIALLGVVCATAVFIMFPEIITTILMQTQRGLHIETLAASMIMFVNLIFPIELHIDYVNYTYELGGPLPDVLAAALPFVMLLACLVLAAILFIRLNVLKKNGELDKRKMKLALVAGCSCVIPLVLMLSPLLSTSFFVWLIPSVCFLSYAKDVGKKGLLAFVLMMVFTFICHFSYPAGMSMLSVIVMLTRNLLVVAFVYYAFKTMLGYTSRTNIESNVSDV